MLYNEPFFSSRLFTGSDYFTEIMAGKCVSQEDGSNQWIPGSPLDHAYLAHKMPQAELAEVIEDLLLTPPFQ